MTARLFATAPVLPDQPFASMDDWEKWLDDIIKKCLRQSGPDLNVVVLPEMANLPMIAIDQGLTPTQVRKLEASLRAYQRLARKNKCHLVASGLFLEDTKRRLVNRLWVIDPRGAILHTYDKQRLTEEEKQYGLTVGSHADPFFRIGPFRLAAIICFDMFDHEIQNRIRSGKVSALVVPSANPHPWAGYATSGVWQPQEWLEGSNWIMSAPAPIVFVNSMLKGIYGPFKFDGQPFIRGQGGTEPSGFPRDGQCKLPSTGFYPARGGIFYIDLTAPLIIF